MIQVNGKDYELKYTLKRLSLAETSAKVGIISELQKTTGFLPIGILVTFLAYAIKKPSDNSWIDPTKGQNIAEQYIEEVGVMDATLTLTNLLKEDCNFLFKQPKGTNAV